MYVEEVENDQKIVLFPELLEEDKVYNEETWFPLDVDSYGIYKFHADLVPFDSGYPFNGQYTIDVSFKVYIQAESTLFTCNKMYIDGNQWENEIRVSVVDYDKDEHPYIYSNGWQEGFDKSMYIELLEEIEDETFKAWFEANTEKVSTGKLEDYLAALN